MTTAATGSATASDAEVIRVAGRAVRVSHPGRVLWPRVGFTKRDLIEYLLAVAPALLPHVRGRGLTLRRFPESVEGPGWFQAECRGAPPWVETAPMWSDRKGEDIHFCRLEDAASLLWSVNHGNLEMHPLLSVAPDFDTPTAMIFDLDPGEGASILDAAAIALLLRDMLRAVGLESLPKSTGSKGVQVYVPLNTPITFDRTKAFARDVAAVLAARLPDRVVARVDKRLRTGKVLVDWGQNDRHKSTVAPYSLRAKLARPTVSLPVTWDALAAVVDDGAADALLPSPEEALERVADAGDLFAPALTVAQQLPG